MFLRVLRRLSVPIITFSLLTLTYAVVFAATAATIVAGVVAERTKLTAYLGYSFLVSALVYPIYGHWVWGGGWLAELGAVDFAGSGVVHTVGALVGLSGAAMVGARIGKYEQTGSPRKSPGTTWCSWLPALSSCSLDGSGSTQAARLRPLISASR